MREQEKWSVEISEIIFEVLLSSSMLLYAPLCSSMLLYAPIDSYRLTIGSQRLSKAPKGSQRIPKAPKGSQRLPKALKCSIAFEGFLNCMWIIIAQCKVFFKIERTLCSKNLYKVNQNGQIRLSFVYFCKVSYQKRIIPWGHSPPTFLKRIHFWKTSSSLAVKFSKNRRMFPRRESGLILHDNT